MTTKQELLYKFQAGVKEEGGVADKLAAEAVMLASTADGAAIVSAVLSLALEVRELRYTLNR